MRVKRTYDVPGSVADELSMKMDAIDEDCLAGKNVTRPSLFHHTLQVIRSLLMITYGLALSLVIIMVFISMHALITDDLHIAQFITGMLLNSGR